MQRKDGALFREPHDRVNTEPTVLSIPDKFLHDSQSQVTNVQLDETKEDSPRVKIDSDVSTLSIPNNQQLINGPNTSQSLTRSWSVGNDASVTSLSVSMSSGNVHLSRTSGSHSDTAELVSLPNWFGLGNTKQTLIPPRNPGEMLRISIDREPLPVSRTNPEICPSILERDPRFVTMPQSLRSIMQCPAEGETALDSRKRRRDDTELDMKSDWVEFENGSISGKFLLPSEAFPGKPSSSTRM